MAVLESSSVVVRHGERQALVKNVRGSEPAVYVSDMWTLGSHWIKFGVMLTDKEIYAIVKKPTVTEIIRLYRLCWFGHVQTIEENRIPKRLLYMNL
jgi:hypothetical protein